MYRPQILSIPERLEHAPRVYGRGVVIGIIDSGFYPHQDLMRPRRRVKAYADATTDSPVGSEFFTPQPWTWHGTMTACCCAGNGYVSGGRYRGLAPESEVVLIKASIEGGRIFGKHVAHAIRFPLRHPQLGIQILNVSLGTRADDPDQGDVLAAVEEVVKAGITVVVAAGNAPGRGVTPPASSPFAITVGGQNDHGTLEAKDDALYPSSYGAGSGGVHKPDLIAPAIWVPAPMLPGTLVMREATPLFQLLSVLEEASAEYGFSETRQVVTSAERESVEALIESVTARIKRAKYISPDYQHVDGTSFAAPIAASVCAQMLEVAPKLRPDEVRQGLLDTAVPIKDVGRDAQGAGVLQARAAVQWARERAG